MKAPWFKFFPRDFATDSKLLACSIEARGTLVYLMCEAHLGTPYGYLADEEGPTSEKVLAIKCGVRLEDFREYLQELRDMGRIADDGDGRLYVPRMAKDGDICRARSEAGKLGGRPPKKQNESKTEANQNQNESKHQSKASVSDSVSEKEKGSGEKQGGLPPEPPKPDEPEEPEEPKSEFETELDEVVRAIHDRHPAPRRCGPAMIRDRLRKIANGHPKGERIAVLNGIDKRHAAWCATDAWTKDGGEYAKGLENWLAPSMQRYNDEPPQAKPQIPQMPSLFFKR